MPRLMRLIFPSPSPINSLYSAKFLPATPTSDLNRCYHLLVILFDIFVSDLKYNRCTSELGWGVTMTVHHAVTAECDLVIFLGKCKKTEPEYMAVSAVNSDVFYV